MSSRADRPSTARRRSRRRRSPVGLVLGLVLLVIGLTVLAWFGYQYVGTTIISQQSYGRTATRLAQDWSSGQKSPSTGASGDVRPDGTVIRIPGDAVGIMRVPAFGASWAVPILDGTDQSVLARGLGWYENTVGPGQVGNFAVAGHVVTHGQPFRQLRSLQKGATIDVEVRDAVYTYAVDSSTTVTDTDTWVLDPVPGHPGEHATDKLITLTTCADVFRSPDRYIVFGHLVSTRQK